MSGWTIEIWSLDGTTQLVAPASFRSAQCTWALEGDHKLEVDLITEDLLAGDWHFGRRRLKLKGPGGGVKFQGWLERVERSGRPGNVVIKATALGLGGALRHGVLHPFIQTDDTGPATAWEAIQNAMAQDNNQWGFTLGTVTGGTGGSRNRHYGEGEVVRDILDDLSDRFQNGFDWEIDETGAFNTWRPLRGLDRTDTVTLSAEDTNDFNIWGDFADADTWITGIGPDRHIVTVDDSVDNIEPRFGRREATVDFSQENECDPDDLEDRAVHELRMRRAVRRGCKASWIEGRGPWDFGDVWLGDAIEIEEGPPFAADLGGDSFMGFQEDAFQMNAFVIVHAYRCTTVSVTLEPGKHEFIEVEFERCFPTAEGLPAA